MQQFATIAFMGVAVLCAFGCGVAVVMALGRREEQSRRKKQVLAAGGAAERPACRWASKGLSAALLDYALRTDEQIQHGIIRPFQFSWLQDEWSAEQRSVMRQAGMSEQFSRVAYREARIRITALLIVLLGCCGLLISNMLGIVLAFVGCGLGCMSLRWAVRQEIQARERALARDLPEMLEVVALGLRSGLSFERSFSLYHSYFDTAFAQACARAQQRWSMGLMTREEVLRELSSSYRSRLLDRVVETIIRSLRFGSALAEPLNEYAHEARQAYKAEREEQAAKAPIKMMIPTGTLILPAMLMLVLGPILLELIGGF